LDPAPYVEGGHFTKELSRQHCSLFGTSTKEIKEANFLMMKISYRFTWYLFYDLGGQEGGLRILEVEPWATLFENCVEI
jgi:hypothetical protein